ncbi:glycosyltransferase [Thiohalocapsa marina]|uniref:Glycosyltransferase n=1 Tax=Thiohalocapsa marina TaxID=424902 RepID=A0A5M8FQ69_9GAMM|nr:glycosyltransferase [Thiohalocapsa marina]KAA6186907.1 glycosyltransferase [Thiohalocapsa marina]
MTCSPWPSSLHLIGSKASGGAERWLQRFARALAERDAPAAVGVRAESTVAELDMGGLPLYSLPFRSIWDPVSRHAVTRLIRRLRPSIVQTYMGRATRLTRLSNGGGAVHVARLGGYYKLSPYRHAHAWIGNTRGLCDWMVAQGLPPARVYHIYNFVNAPRPRLDAEIDQLRMSLGMPADAWALVTMGRFVPVKGHRVLLSALTDVPDEIDGRPWRLILVGDGPLASELIRQSRDAGLQDRVIWAGWQEDPAPFLQLADLVVFPSNDPETLGNVILEAWAWQRPLVTTRFRGARELTHHGEDAWCVPCEDASALAEGIRRVLGDASLRSALVRGGARRAADEFAEAVIMDRYLNLYRRLLSE